LNFPAISVARCCHSGPQEQTCVCPVLSYVW